ncbi:hypothetical protein ACRAWD_25710 [Caulobacter segnis]
MEALGKSDTNPAGYDPLKLGAIFKELEADVVRRGILDTGLRIDGRDVRTVRPILGEVGILPRTHGSALFTRGETQAIVVATLGTGDDEQFIDALEGTYKEILPAALQLPALLGRRDGPHGLAGPSRDRPRQSWPGAPCARCCRARPRVPLHDPRVVSEITESNGSSSMAHGLRFASLCA